jgi:xanthine dehydrogenase small subunit
MIRFILNEKEQNTNLPPGMVLLDFIRYHKHLTGTKIGCREGDCGACTVLIGELKFDELVYRSVTSCLTPLGSVQNKHVVTIEGLNTEGLNPVQQAMTDFSATQCGFCTPGFVVSLAGYCLSKKEATQENAVAAIDGNICRCTGYKSIERAAAQITQLLAMRGEKKPLPYAVDTGMLPAYFTGIKQRLQLLSLETNGAGRLPNNKAPLVGGGTDLYVQKHEEIKDTDIRLMTADASLKRIIKRENKYVLGPSVTVTDLLESPLLQDLFPGLKKMVKLVSSTPIRNMATVAGNFINASPIGDLTIFFLALDASVVLSDGEQSRVLPLRKLYNGYKVLDKKPEEFISEIAFERPTANTLINFEKVSKRTHLDIASVNSTLCLQIKNNQIEEAGLSAGGVGPVPLFLEKTASFLKGKWVSENLVAEAVEIAQTEISPISDARGTAAYKGLLLKQLIKAHFITLFPKMPVRQLIHF